MNNRLNYLLQEYRMGNILDDCGGVNRLFGLKDLILENLNKDSIICEIGSYEGKSSELFAIFCKQIYCVDIFNDISVVLKFDDMMSNYNNIIKIKKLSVDASKDFPDNFFDCVYIDANHDYESVKEDILCWISKIKKGGFLTGHDYHYGSGGVYEALKEIFKDIVPQEYSDSSWLIKL